MRWSAEADILIVGHRNGGREPGTVWQRREVFEIVKKKSKNSKGARPRVEVDVAKLDQLVDKTELGPLQQEERSELKSAIHQLATEVARQQEMRKRHSSTEKAKKLMAEHATILGKSSEPQEDGRAESDEKPKRSGGNGRNAASDYVGASKVNIPLADEFKPKAPCSVCGKGRFYLLDPSPLVRIKGIGQGNLRTRRQRATSFSNLANPGGIFTGWDILEHLLATRGRHIRVRQFKQASRKLTKFGG